MNDNTTKNKIIESMYNLVAEKGYDKASIGQISESIGIKKASVYYYFKSKEEIFIEMVKGLYTNDYYNRAELFREEIGADLYKNELMSVGEEFIDSYFENTDLRKVFAEIDIQTTRIVALKELMQVNDAGFKNFLIKCMKQGVDVGAFPADFDIILNAQILYTVLIGVDQAILYELPIDPKAVWKEVVHKLFERKAH